MIKLHVLLIIYLAYCYFKSLLHNGAELFSFQSSVISIKFSEPSTPAHAQ